MDYEYNLLERKFNELPPEMQLALTSTEVADDIKDIATRNNLMIDQESTLYDLISYVLLGLLSSDQFVATLSKEAHVEAKTATLIAQQVNDEVISKIRSSIREIQESEKQSAANKQGISDLEHIGGFSIEKEQPETETTSLKVPEKDKILSNLEDRPAADPLVDHLLTSSNTQAEEKIVQTSEGHVEHHTEPPIPPNLPTDEAAARMPDASIAAKTAPIQAPPPQKAAPSKPAGPDPYRETFN